MFTRSSMLLKCELCVYFAVYIIYIVIGLYKIFALRERILEISYFEFPQGWTWLGRPRDDTNDELENFTHYIYTNWYWYLHHILISGIIRHKWPHLHHYGNMVVCVLAILFNFHKSSALIFFVLLLSFYCVTKFHRRKKTIWLLTGTWMLIITLLKGSQSWYDYVGYTEYFTLLIVISWSLLRCCSFALTCINDSSSENLEKYYNYKFYLGYTMYFPCLAYGPFISYKRFIAAATQTTSTDDNEHPKKPNFRATVWELFRVFSWWLIMQLALHYFYIHYMSRDVKAIALIGSVFWQHAAGYFMGQFFFLYYIVTYGLGIAIARFDGIDPPRRPRCIGCVHFYSDMWRYFDEGLYEFLFGHIYKELCDSQLKRFYAMLVTFGFVFVWHGCYTYVLIWCVLNFLCLALEKGFKWFLKTTPMHWAEQHLGPTGAQRLYALLATQIFIPAAFSNVYFISGQEVGNFLMKGAYGSGIGNYLALCFCSYCFFQCSEVLMNLRQSKLNKIKNL